MDSGTGQHDGDAVGSGPPAGIETPRLAASLRAAFAGTDPDARALHRIIEAQAEDLVRLRRELASARARLTAFSEDGGRGIPDDEVAALLRAAQADIEAVTERSRWLRLGRLLRLARPTAWEGGDWRSPCLSGSGEVPPAGLLRAELRRLERLRDELGRSRWRRLGHRLGLSRPLPSELAGPPPPAADEIADAPPADAADRLRTVQFVDQCKAFAVDAVLDVGANGGQFARALREAGWLGHIVSFEPLSRAHAELREAAAEDALWDVAERCALGAARGVAEINLAGNSWSSSLLPMTALHREAAPQSAYDGRESCEVVTLDEAIGATFSDPTTLLALKIDAQGYERQVLDGLRIHGPQVRVLLCELSLADLYEGGAGIGEMMAYLASRDFHCLALSPAFADPRTGHLLQVDGLFVAG